MDTNCESFYKQVIVVIHQAICMEYPLIPDLREKILYQRLNEIERPGFIERIIFNSKPVTVKYRLTPEGQKALPV